MAETPEGPGRVIRIWNATRWQPAWVQVELEDGSRRMFNGSQVRVTR